MRGTVAPSPATRAIFRLLKAGERVFQTLLLTKTVFRTPKGAQPLFQARFGVKILSGTLFAPPLLNAGYGARLQRAAPAPRVENAHRGSARRHSYRGAPPAPGTHAFWKYLQAGENSMPDSVGDKKSVDGTYTRLPPSDSDIYPCGTSVCDTFPPAFTSGSRG